MALNEQLNKFKHQQARCQTTLSSIAASQASFSKLKITPGFQPKNAPLAPAKPVQPIKFSNDTQRLQHINSVRKSPTGSQLKLVIDLLYKTRQAFTAEQINEATYVDIAGNKDVFEHLMGNIKVLFDGKRYSYKPKHDLKGRDGLLNKIRDNVDGLDVADVIDSYPSVLEDLQALKESGDILWLSGTESQEGVVYPNDPRSKITVDADLKELYNKIELPRDMLDIEKELQKIGEKALTNTAKRRELAMIHGATRKPKPKKKPRGLTSRSKLTNVHMPELFEDKKR
ncbi:hypothetical protein EJB05_07850 [Eragrostis curvula]|uniref:TFIIE beta domain-containing protein n=1 Tax=Eragrostis curvula TaxID=38414 RepID=A0A5J9WJH4_9POAL|nr:hypothetical protein EJB05_07850 [Eragrostis curvula]